MKKLISILVVLLITASIFILPMSVSAKDNDVITLRISNCEEYIDEGNWDKDDTIDLDSGDIIGKNSMITDFENPTPIKVAQDIQAWLASVDVKEKLEDIGFTADDVDKLVDLTFETPSLAGLLSIAPSGNSKEIVKQIYTDSLKQL